MEDIKENSFNESFNSSMFDSMEIPTLNVELIYFIDNNPKKVDRLAIRINNDKIENITYDDITYSFYLFLKKSQNEPKCKNDKKGDDEDEDFLYIKPDSIIYEYIRYFDGEGWTLLENDDIIFIDQELNSNNIKIMIKANVLCGEKMDIKKNYDKIDKEINHIYSDLLKAENDDSLPDAPLNLIVLTANPLMDGKDELRTMNDFNIIASKIYESFSEEEYLKYTEFRPLTKKILREVISHEEKRPVILHLIFKSIYLIPEKSDKLEATSEKYTNLIFEKDPRDKGINIDLEFMDKTKLKEEVFNFNLMPEIIENIKKITLIISTPLAEDVYYIFKDFGFKNILVQPTTYANVNFIGNFNYRFYKDLIRRLSNPIYQIYEDALNDYIDKSNPPTFCCCFHKHKTTCNFFKYYRTEIYNDTDKNKKKIDDLEKYLPHFYHLYPSCSSKPDCGLFIYESKIENKITDEKFPDDSFILHFKSCFEDYSFLKSKKWKTITIEIKNTKKKVKKNIYSLCCCEEDPKRHSINYIFQKDFSKDKNNNQIKFRKTEIMREKKYFPDYNKMKFLVGKNKIIADIIKFFFSANNRYCNIYGENMEYLKMIGKTIIEYYKERYYSYESNEEGHKEEKNMKLNLDIDIKFNKSLQDLNMIEDDDNNDLKKLDDDFQFISHKSSPILPLIETQNKIDIEEIDLNNNEKDIFGDDSKHNFNKIYFIYVNDRNSLNRVKIKNKIVWFKIASKKDSKEELVIRPELKAEKEYKKATQFFPNEYIQFQDIKNLRNNWRKKKD